MTTETARKPDTNQSVIPSGSSRRTDTEFVPWPDVQVDVIPRTIPLVGSLPWDGQSTSNDNTSSEGLPAVAVACFGRCLRFWCRIRQGHRHFQLICLRLFMKIVMRIDPSFQCQIHFLYASQSQIAYASGQKMNRSFGLVTEEARHVRSRSKVRTTSVVDPSGVRIRCSLSGLRFAWYG
jgi:hypothetical protein